MLLLVHLFTDIDFCESIFFPLWDMLSLLQFVGLYFLQPVTLIFCMGKFRVLPLILLKKY